MHIIGDDEPRKGEHSTRVVWERVLTQKEIHLGQSFIQTTLFRKITGMHPQELSESASANHPFVPFSDDAQIAVVPLRAWLDWVTQKNCDVFVALPMIQRGSVWKADAIADLWDSLLRGMPVGSLTICRLERTTTKLVRTFEKPEAEKQTIQAGSLFLLDGQQRTLAMCIGWPWKRDVGRRVWVDFGQPGIAGQPFRLRVTTEYQPFGFKQNDQSVKLSREEKRRARKHFDAKGENRTRFENTPDYKLPLDETEPYGALHPLELRGLIKNWQNAGKNIESWVQRVLDLRSFPDASPKDEIERRIRAFGEALHYLFQTQIALVRVKQELVDHDDDEDDNSTPALVVLFNRIANAGKPLSNVDYIFALIKHRFPEAHNLVQELHAESNVSCLLTENDLVMTAVRLAANSHTHDGGIPFADNPSPNPKEFGRMLKSKVDGTTEGNFLANALMPLIQSGSNLSLHRAFKEAHQLLEFRENSDLPDAGLPKLAFPLLQRQLVQVIVFWIHLRHRSQSPNDLLIQPFDKSRAEILRFVLFWLLCVENKYKEAASKIAFEMLREGENRIFPGKAIYQRLCDGNMAVRLKHPDLIELSAVSSLLPGATIRSNYSRFYTTNADGVTIESEPLFRRWFFRWDLLLWLQRTTLEGEFDGANPLAGRDEETPYDYDHICPAADWSADYRQSQFPMKHFCERKEAWVLGDSIGNIRVEESSSNRSYGDTQAAEKLGLDDIDSLETRAILERSAITKTEAIVWKACSVDRTHQGNWDNARALAFQEVVEGRALRLFRQYVKEGGLDEWISVPRGPNGNNIDRSLTGVTSLD